MNIYIISIPRNIVSVEVDDILEISTGGWRGLRHRHRSSSGRQQLRQPPKTCPCHAFSSRLEFLRPATQMQTLWLVCCITRA